MILVFEGHDRSGKTTIAEAVAKKLGTEVFMTNSKESFTERSTFSKDSSAISIFNYHIALYLKALKESGNLTKPVIIYRSFLSEKVYSELLGRLTNEVYNDNTDNLLSDLGATMVLLKNSSARIYNDDTLDDDLVRKSVRLYEKHRENINCDCIEIDTAKHDVDAYVERIIEYAKAKENVFR